MTVLVQKGQVWFPRSKGKSPLWITWASPTSRYIKARRSESRNSPEAIYSRDILGGYTLGHEPEEQDDPSLTQAPPVVLGAGGKPIPAQGQCWVRTGGRQRDRGRKVWVLDIVTEDGQKYLLAQGEHRTSKIRYEIFVKEFVPKEGA